MSGTAAMRSADQQARFDAALKQLFEHRVTFNSVLGLKVLSLQPGDVRVGFAMRPELIGHYAFGRLHGGVISAALDSACGLAVMVGIAANHAADSVEQVMQRFSRVGTIDLRVDYLRQGLGSSFEGRAEITRLGGRLASTQARLVNDEGVLIATAAAAYIVS